MKPIEVVCTVKENKWISPTVFQLSFQTEPTFIHQAGQFISIVIPGAGPGGRDLRRAYSIASAPGESMIQLCIRKVDDGPGTGFLSSLQEGQQFRGMAPYGHFVFKPKPGKNACFIATGTGISPFRSILKSEHFNENRPGRFWCIFGSTSEEEIFYQKELEKIPDLNWAIALSRSGPTWKGFKGRVTDYLRQNKEKFPWLETDFYLCGNGAMIDEVKKILTEYEVAKENVHQEVYYKPKVEKQI